MVYKPTNTGWRWLEPWNFMTFSWEFHILSQLTKSIIFQRGRYKNHQPDGRGGIITTTGEAIHSSRGLLFETWGTYQFSSRHGGCPPPQNWVPPVWKSIKKSEKFQRCSKCFPGMVKVDLVLLRWSLHFCCQWLCFSDFVLIALIGFHRTLEESPSSHDPLILCGICW